MTPSPWLRLTTPSYRSTALLMQSRAGWSCCSATSGSVSSISAVEFFTSAKRTVSCLRSPPLALRFLNRRFEIASGARGAWHCAHASPESGGLVCPQAAQANPSDPPHDAQYFAVARLSLPQRGHCIQRPSEISPEEGSIDDSKNIYPRPEQPPTYALARNAAPARKLSKLEFRGRRTYWKIGAPDALQTRVVTRLSPALQNGAFGFSRDQDRSTGGAHGAACRAANGTC